MDIQEMVAANMTIEEVENTEVNPTNEWVPEQKYWNLIKDLPTNHFAEVVDQITTEWIAEETTNESLN